MADPKKSADDSAQGTPDGRADDASAKAAENISTTSFTDFGAPADPHDLAGEPVGVIADDDVPDELRAEPAGETATGLVSEFHELSRRQMAYLVANRETASTLRSPLFVAAALALVLGVLAALIIGLGQTQASDGGDRPTVAMMVPKEQKELLTKQIPQVEQNLGMKVEIVTSLDEGRQAVSRGTVDAFLIQDPTGQGKEQLMAKRPVPKAMLEKLSQQPKVTYIDAGPVKPEVGRVLAWAMAALSLVAALTLGAASYLGIREERRGHMSEVIVAAVPARTALWGRLWGLTQLAILLLLITAGIGLLGMTVIGHTATVVAALPAVGWFAAAFVLYCLAVAAAFALAAMGTRERTRKIALAAVGVAVVVLAFVPLMPIEGSAFPMIAAWLPFAEPTGVGAFALMSAAPWWQSLIAVASAGLVALIAVSAALSRYAATVLSGAGIAGRAAVAKKKPKAESKAADTDDADDAAESAESDADSAEGDSEKAADSEAASEAASEADAHADDADTASDSKA